MYCIYLHTVCRLTFCVKLPEVCFKTSRTSANFYNCNIVQIDCTVKNPADGKVVILLI